jgi:hypothetical protein
MFWHRYCKKRMKKSKDACVIYEQFFEYIFIRRECEMKSKRLDKLAVYVVALLFIAIFCGEISAMVAIANHECQGPGCIELVHGE